MWTDISHKKHGTWNIYKEYFEWGWLLDLCYQHKPPLVGKISHNIYLLKVFYSTFLLLSTARIYQTHQTYNKKTCTKQSARVSTNVCVFHLYF